MDQYPIWRKTQNIRFVWRYESDEGRERILQQQWITGDGDDEWRDVPCVEED